jgi:hypothetical protein
LKPLLLVNSFAISLTFEGVFLDKQKIAGQTHDSFSNFYFFQLLLLFLKNSSSSLALTCKCLQIYWGFCCSSRGCQNQCKDELRMHLMWAIVVIVLTSLLCSFTSSSLPELI